MDNPIEKLAKYFKEFPGIGERQAKRFVYFLLHKNNQYVKELAQEINNIQKLIHQCPSCYIFFRGNKKDLCETCNNPKTNKSLLLITEKDADCENIKKSKNYSGMYFVLGGLAPIINKETFNFLRLKELLNIVENRCEEKDGENKLKEIILALSLNPQGEHTDMYLREQLSYLQKKYQFKIVSLGRGLSTGTELEYSDNETIKNALLNRQ
jgi:recombination protein RecR